MVTEDGSDDTGSVPGRVDVLLDDHGLVNHRPGKVLGVSSALFTQGKGTNSRQEGPSVRR